MVDGVREPNYHRSRREWCVAWGSGQPQQPSAAIEGPHAVLEVMVSQNSARINVVDSMQGIPVIERIEGR